MIELRYCGGCCWFKHDDVFGWAAGWGTCTCKNDLMKEHEEACYKYTGRAEVRHHVAVLLQANRYRRDPHVPAIYRMPRPVELGRAIDFAVKYIKTHTKR